MCVQFHSLRPDKLCQKYAARTQDNIVRAVKCSGVYIAVMNKVMQSLDALVYVDIGANFGDSASISFSFDGTTTQRTWDIKITQIECRNPSA